MPGVTSLGLRYPLQGETVDATSWQNLANDVDALMTTIKGFRDKAFRAPTASIGNSGGPAISSASLAQVTMQYNVVDWDTSGLVNLGVNNDRITITPGIWIARFSTSLLTGYTTLTRAVININDVGGNIWGVHQAMDITSLSSVNTMTVTAMIVTNAPLGIIGTVFWQGTGGPATWTSPGQATLQVARVRELADV